jgi:hypothetical protein
MDRDWRKTVGADASANHENARHRFPCNRC